MSYAKSPKINKKQLSLHNFNHLQKHSPFVKPTQTQFLSKVFRERQKSSEFHIKKCEEVMVTEIKQQNLIDTLKDEEIKEFFKTKFIILKKGKILGKQIIRYAQISPSNKILYFTSNTDLKPKGYYSLYQSQTFLTEINLTSQIRKIINYKANSSTISALSYQSQDKQTNIYLLYLNQDNEITLNKGKALDILYEFCQLGSNGEIESFLEERKIEVQDILPQVGGLSRSVNWREEELSNTLGGQTDSPFQNYYNKDNQYKNQRLLPQLTQKFTIRFLSTPYSRQPSSQKVPIQKSFKEEPNESLRIKNLKLNNSQKSILSMHEIQNKIPLVSNRENNISESEIGDDEEQSGGIKTIKQMKKGVLNSTEYINIQNNNEKTQLKLFGGEKPHRSKVLYKPLTFGVQEQFQRIQTKLNNGDMGDDIKFSEEDEQELNQLKRGEDLVGKIKNCGQSKMSKYDQCNLSSLILVENAECEEEFTIKDERLQTIQNMDSNLNTLQDEFSKLSLSIQINQLKEDQGFLPNKFQKESNSPKSRVKEFLLNTESFENFLINSEQNMKTSHRVELQSDKLGSVEKLYMGIYESWNFKFENAKEVFKVGKNQDIRMMLHNFEISIFKALITGKKSLIDKALMKVVNLELIFAQQKQHFNKLKQILHHKKVQKQDKSLRFFNIVGILENLTSESLELLIAELLMFKAVLKFLQGNRFKSFLIFRECWKTYKKYESFLQKDAQSLPYWFDPDFKSRLLLGLGLFYLGISALPKSLSTIVQLVGFSGNRVKGMKYLKECLENKRCRSPYAALILSLYLIDQEQCVDEVCGNLIVITSNFPCSSLFHWLSSIVSWKFCQLDDAVYFIQRALVTCPQELSTQAAFLKYEVGWFHYLKLEFDQSLLRFKEVLRDCLNLEYEDQVDEEKPQEQNQTISYGHISQGNDRYSSRVYNEFVLKLGKHNTTINSEQHSPNKIRQGSATQRSPDGLRGLDSFDQSKKEDFVYLPHRACLAIQMAGAYVQVKQYSIANDWLNTTIKLANQPGITRSKLDQDMGHLANLFLKERKTMELLTYEIIYFLHQMPKLPNTILLEILANISKVLKSLNISLNCQEPSEYKNSEYFAEYASGMMLTIICYCFLGDTEIACLFSDRFVKCLPLLPINFQYLVAHGFYWAGRSHLAEGNPQKAYHYLMKAKKVKKYDFPIELKIDRVLQDIKKNHKNL